MTKYIIYARRYSESEDKQVLSIHSQISELIKLSTEQNLDVSEVFFESCSAKKSRKRPIFSKVLRLIRREAASGIIVWSFDRLSRNAGDAGILIDLFDDGRLKEVVTPLQTFRNNPNDKFFLSLLLSQAKLDNDQKSLNVKRGNKTKLKQGWLPGKPPLGYLNDRVNGTIVSDPKRFHLVRKMWDLMLMGNYSVAEIIRIANEKMGLKTRLSKRLGGKSLSRAIVYNIFSNSFYAGVIVRNGKAYQGSHKPMITQEEFEAVRKRLDKKKRCT